MGTLLKPPAYKTVHNRMTKQFGSARNYECVDCGEQALQWSYNGGDPKELVQRTGPSNTPLAYSADPSYYSPRCKRCHLEYDVAVRWREGRGGHATWVAKRGKWQAQHNVNGKNKWLGYHDTAEEARQAVLDYRAGLLKNPPPSVEETPLPLSTPEAPQHFHNNTPVNTPQYSPVNTPGNTPGMSPLETPRLSPVHSPPALAA